MPASQQELTHTPNMASPRKLPAGATVPLPWHRPLSTGMEKKFPHIGQGSRVQAVRAAASPELWFAQSPVLPQPTSPSALAREKFSDKRGRDQLRADLSAMPSGRGLSEEDISPSYAMPCRRSWACRRNAFGVGVGVSDSTWKRQSGTAPWPAADILAGEDWSAAGEISLRTQWSPPAGPEQWPTSGRIPKAPQKGKG